MLQIKRKMMDPPSGWTFRVENGFLVRANTFDNLVRAVKQHLYVNGHPCPANIAEIIENDICHRNPDTICKGEGPARHFPTAREVEQTTRKMVDMISKIDKDSYVTQRRAEERAQICMSCPKKQNVWSCFGCAQIIKIVTKTFKRTTPYDRHLYACAVCKCLNSAQVHLKTEILALSTEKKTLPEFPEKCWKRQELEKHYGNE